MSDKYREDAKEDVLFLKGFQRAFNQFSSSVLQEYERD